MGKVIILYASRVWHGAAAYGWMNYLVWTRQRLVVRLTGRDVNCMHVYLLRLQRTVIVYLGILRCQVLKSNLVHNI
jgi:hypothetical protein